MINVIEFKKWYFYEDDAREVYKVLLTKEEFIELSLYFILYIPDPMITNIIPTWKENWESIHVEELLELIA